MISALRASYTVIRIYTTIIVTEETLCLGFRKIQFRGVLLNNIVVSSTAANYIVMHSFCLKEASGHDSWIYTNNKCD